MTNQHQVYLLATGTQNIGMSLYSKTKKEKGKPLFGVLHASELIYPPLPPENGSQIK